MVVVQSSVAEFLTNIALPSIVGKTIYELENQVVAGEEHHLKPKKNEPQKKGFDFLFECWYYWF